MNDDLEELKRRLKETPSPKPDEGRKNAAISMALAAFEQKTSTSSQGTSRLDRLIRTAWAGLRNFLQEGLMKKTRLAVGAAVAIIAVLSVSTLYTGQTSRVTAVTHRMTPPQMKEAPNGPAAPYFLGQQKVADADRAKNALKEGASSLPTTAPPMAMAQSDLAATAAGSSLSTPVGQNAGIDETQPSEKPKNDALIELQGEIVHQNRQIAPMKKQQQLQLNQTKGKENAFGYPQSLAMINKDVTAPYYHDQGRDKFEEIKVNPVKITQEEPVSTFSVDVDTSSYSFVRASLNQNLLPQKDAVRIEEMINYFPYDYEAPKDKDVPFKANVSVMPTPWNANTKLVHIGIKGYEIEQKEKPHSNLVFLIDTSGSMNEPNKLPLVQNALKMLLDTLKEDDTIGIVTYAGNAGIALEPTKVKDKMKIVSTIDNLTAWGSTAGAEGIRLAYQLAHQNFDKDAVNRVILSTDGDFNVGITNQDELKSFIERERESGIFLSVLGYGMGNYNDAMMQTLAQNGNGNAAYIDTINEARKVLVQEASSTLFTIAKDVKIQVEFNPATVSEYRLIGYENRLLKREDFNNDKVDAGDIGSGHTVTALYEITLVDSKARLVDDLRYAEKKEAAKDTGTNDEYAFVKIRYKLPNSDTSKLITTPVDGKVEFKKLDQTPKDALFATAVAAFGQILRGDPYTRDFKYDDVIALAEANKGADPFGYRSEFINLVRVAKNAPGLPVQQ